MVALDWLILVLILIGTWRGFSTGFIREIARFIGLILAFFWGVQLMHTVGHLAQASLGFSTRLAPLVGFLLVFAAVLLAIHGVARLVEHLIGVLQLGPVNNVLGGLVGAMRTALWLSIFFLVAGAIGFPGSEMRRHSLLYQPVQGAVPRVWSVASDWVPGLSRLSREFGIEPGRSAAR